MMCLEALQWPLLFMEVLTTKKGFAMDSALVFEGTTGTDGQSKGFSPMFRVLEVSAKWYIVR